MPYLSATSRARCSLRPLMATTRARAWLDGADDGVPAAVEMRGRMFVLRRVTAAHVPADQALAQVHPPIAHRQALLTALCARRHLADLTQMCTCRHDPLSF